eukprot:8743729-Pyramimonas_sp.AAC.1
MAGGHMNANELRPVFISFDVCAAFPSMSWIWIQSVLDHHKIATGFLMAIRALYHDMQSWTWCGDSLQFLFHVSAGVAQGCPLPGSLWALTFDPFLHHLRNGNMEGYG